MWKILSKFGLQHCDLPTMVSIISRLLRVLTLNVDSRYKKSIPLIFYILMAIITACFVYIYLVSMVWFVFWRSHDKIDTVLALALGIATEIGPCKLIIMFLYRDEIIKIVDGYLRCDATVLKGSRFSENLLKSLMVVKKRIFTIWIIIWGNAFIYIMKPVILPGRHFTEDYFIYLGLEPMSQTPNYEIAYTVNSLAIFMPTYPAVAITTFFLIVVGYAEGTMLALSKELLHLWDDAQQHYQNTLCNNTEFSRHGDRTGHCYKEKVINQFIKEHLQKIVDIHTTILNLVVEVEYVFRNVAAVEFGLLSISLVVELLGGLENTFAQMTFCLMQVTMHCFMGQRLVDAVMVLEEAVYDCKWENFDSANMKTVLLILHNSQRTITLSAGGITKINFESLMNIIKAIYSVYTTLRSTMT